MKWAVRTGSKALWLEVDGLKLKDRLALVENRSEFAHLPTARAWALLAGGKVIRIKTRRTAEEERARIVEFMSGQFANNTAIWLAQKVARGEHWK